MEVKPHRVGGMKPSGNPITHARKVRDVAPLACKTDKVAARVLAELVPP